ncbi:MAG: zinc ribbon domain-containing protein [Oscillospiraceae bacterium]|nr:zinc ribbon domain-containing protein [Oscillospiraceae bacterium]
MAFCGGCGAKVEEGMKFCPECGKSLIKTEPVQDEAVSEKPETTEQEVRTPEAESSAAETPEVRTPEVNTTTKPEIQEDGIKKYRVHISRPSSFVGCAMALRIHIDGNQKEYVLKSGESMDVALTAGTHSIEVGMTAVFKKTKATFTVYSNRKLTCRLNLKGTATNGLLSGPAIIEDEKGKRISY